MRRKPEPAVNRFLVSIVAMLLLTTTVGRLVQAAQSDPHAQHRQMQKEQSKMPAASMTIDVPDAALVTQDGDAVRLVSDVIGSKIVVVDFVYTTCTTVCPVLSATLRQVQKQLGDRLGNDVLLLSISVDPTRDTPKRLKAYAGNLGARDGWIWLTGDKTVIDGVLKAFGAYTPSFEDHPSMVLVGDGASDQWGRFLGFPGTEQLMKRIDELGAARLQAAAKE